MRDLDVVPFVFTPAELLVTLQAVSREAQRQARQNGVRPATLGGVIERMQRAATDLADRDADIRPGRSRPRCGHSDVPSRVVGARSAASGTRPARWPSTSEVAEHLGLSTGHVRRLVRQGLLDGAAVDGRGTWAIDPTSVTVWEARRTTRKAPHDGVEAPRTPPRDRGSHPGSDQSRAAAG
ncbi:helix-turn-helix domain-containing protein [Pseudonocardia adelaidensis]|uniref:helix-turn-helix domain-containing protein n=1 Tax=Pseudonocardia adelaidensis TaxID=648754 RepID=UPI0031E5B486